ncbi:MAG: hypothetical protein R2856_17840 [Caldilineaceae bacterium]
MMVELVNELVGCQGGGVFVLDDFHIVREQSIHDSLIFLVDNLPASLHLVLGTRQDPPWPLARLRASGQMLEVRAADLRFTLDEATAFLNGVERFALLPGDIARSTAAPKGGVAACNWWRYPAQPARRHRCSSAISAATNASSSTTCWTKCCSINPNCYKIS